MFHTFTSKRDRTKITKHIKEAVKVLEWKDAVMEEIRTLEKMKIGI